MRSIETIFVLILLFSSCSTLKKIDFKKVQAVRKEKEVLKVIWNKNYDPIYDSGNLPIGLSSAYVYKNVVYAATASGIMRAHESSTGRILWSHKEMFPMSSSPSVYDNVLFYGTQGGRLIARNTDNGSLKYNIDLGSAIESRPVVWKGRLFVHLRNHKLVSLDATTGKILWAYKRSVPFATTIQRASTPLVKNGKAYLGFADGSVLCLNVNDGVVLWEKKIINGTKFIDVDNEPVLKGNKLYIGSAAGQLHVIDANSGNTLRTLPYNSIRKPLFVGTKTYVGSVDGVVYKLNKYDKEILSKKLTTHSIASVKLWKEDLVVSTLDGKLFLLDKETLDIKYQRHFGSRASSIFSEIAYNDDLLVIYSSRNRLYVFQ